MGKLARESPPLGQVHRLVVHGSDRLSPESAAAAPEYGPNASRGDILEPLTDP